MEERQYLCQALHYLYRITPLLHAQSVHDVESYLQGVLLELGKLPRAAVVRAIVALPDPALVVQDILLKMVGLRIMAAILCREGSDICLLHSTMDLPVLQGLKRTSTLIFPLYEVTEPL